MTQTPALTTRSYTYSDPSALVAAAVGQSGLAFLRAIASGALPQPPISATIGIWIESADEGVARFAGEPSLFVTNPMGTVHGGWAATILDSALGSAVMSTLDVESAYTTAQLSVNLVRAITPSTGRVRCEAHIVHRGARIATAEARLVDGEGRLLAHGTTTCAIFPRR